MTNQWRIKGVAGNRWESKEGPGKEVLESHSRERDHQHLNSGTESCGLGRLTWNSCKGKQSGDMDAWRALWRFLK